MTMYLLLQAGMAGLGAAGGAAAEYKRGKKAKDANKEMARMAEEINAQRMEESEAAKRQNRAIDATAWLSPSPLGERDEKFEKFYPQKQDESFNWESLLGGGASGLQLGSNIGSQMATIDAIENDRKRQEKNDDMLALYLMSMNRNQSPSAPVKKPASINQNKQVSASNYPQLYNPNYGRI